MSTNDFVSKIHKENIISVITNCFDEIMVLYNLVGTKRDMSISLESDSPSARFVLEMGSKEEANNLFESLNNTFFSIYDEKFIIEMELSGRSISTVIYKAIS